MTSEAPVDVWAALALDPQLKPAMKKLSIHELRLIIKHAKADTKAEQDGIRDALYRLWSDGSDLLFNQPGDAWGRALDAAEKALGTASVPASKCDRPDQADAAVAEAVRYEWRRKVDFDGPGPWYPCDRSWIDHLAGDDLYETRSLYVTSEAALLAAKPRSEWRPIETAPFGKWVLLNYGEVFASHTGYRQNDGKWVHSGNREPVAWMLPPSTKLCPLPAPPTAAPSPPVDHVGGQGESDDPLVRYSRTGTMARRTPTPAAPAPGREDGESDGLTGRQREIMLGLRTHGHAYVSVSDLLEVDRLETLGLVETWSTVGGFKAARAAETAGG